MRRRSSSIFRQTDMGNIRYHNNVCKGLLSDFKLKIFIIKIITEAFFIL